MALLAEQFNQMTRKLKKYREMNIEQIIAEKLKSEAIIQSVDDGIIVVDDQLVINNINPTAALIFGVHKDSLMGRHFVEAVREERLFELLKQSVETGRPPQLNEGEDMFTISSEGGSQHYQFSILPMRSSSGAIQGVVLLLRDITQFTRTGPLEERICPDCLPRVAHPAHQREYGRGSAHGVSGAQIDRQGTGTAVSLS